MSWRRRWRWRGWLRDLAGFTACLFDSHDLRYVATCDWLECARCGERRLTEVELLWILARSR